MLAAIASGACAGFDSMFGWHVLQVFTMGIRPPGWRQLWRAEGELYVSPAWRPEELFPNLLSRVCAGRSAGS